MADEAAQERIPQFYTQKELSAMLAVSERTIEGWRFTNIGPAYVRFGGNVRYSDVAIREFIAASQA